MNQKYFYSSKTQLTVLQDGISEEKSEESPTINIQGVGLKPCVLEILNWANLSNFILKQNSVTFEKHKKKNSIIHDLLKRKSEYPKKLLSKRKPQQSSLSPNFRVIQNDIQTRIPGKLQINNTMRFPQKHKVIQRSTTLVNFNKSRAIPQKPTNRNNNLNSSCCCQDCGQKSSKYKLLEINKNNLLDKVFDQFVKGQDDGRKPQIYSYYKVDKRPSEQFFKHAFSRSQKLMSNFGLSPIKDSKQNLLEEDCPKLKLMKSSINLIKLPNFKNKKDPLIKFNLYSMGQNSAKLSRLLTPLILNKSNQSQVQTYPSQRQHTNKSSQQQQLSPSSQQCESKQYILNTECVYKEIFLKRRQLRFYFIKKKHPVSKLYEFQQIQQNKMKKDSTYNSPQNFSNLSNRKLLEVSSQRVGLNLQSSTNYEDENENLRNQIHILEEKQRFYEREYQIKDASKERRLVYLTQTCTSLTQQKTALQLQLQQILQQFSQQTQIHLQLEQGFNSTKQENSRLNEVIQRQIVEIENISSLKSKQKGYAQQRKLQLQQSNREQEELKDHFLAYDQEKSNQLLIKNQEIENYARQVNELQIQNQEYHQHYESLLQNVKNHIVDGGQEDGNLDQENINNVLEQNCQLRMELESILKEVERIKYEPIELIDSQLQVLNKWILSKQDLPDQGQFDQLLQLVFKSIQKLKTKINKLAVKKSKYKTSLQSLTQQILDMRSSEQKISNMSEDPDRYLADQRIQELEQFYQNKIVLFNKPKPFSMAQSLEYPQDKKAFKQQGLIQMLNSYLLVLLEQRNDLRDINYQLSELQTDSRIDSWSQQRQSPIQNRCRKCFHVVRAIIRLKMNVKRQNNYNEFNYRKLQVESLKFPNIQRFLEIMALQQQVIGVMETTLKENQQTFDGLVYDKHTLGDKLMDQNKLLEQLYISNEELQLSTRQGLKPEEVEAIKNIVEQELRKEISEVQLELDQYKQILYENDRIRDQDGNQRDSEVDYLKQQIHLKNYENDQLKTLLDKGTQNGEQQPSKKQKISKLDDTKNNNIRFSSDHGSENDARSVMSRQSVINETSPYERMFFDQESKIRTIENEFEQLTQLFDRLQSEQ